MKSTEQPESAMFLENVSRYSYDETFDKLSEKSSLSETGKYSIFMICRKRFAKWERSATDKSHRIVQPQIFRQNIGA